MCITYTFKLLRFKSDNILQMTQNNNLFSSNCLINPVGTKTQNHVVGFGLHPGQLANPRRGKWSQKRPKVRVP